LGGGKEKRERKEKARREGRESKYRERRGG